MAQESDKDRMDRLERQMSVMIDLSISFYGCLAQLKYTVRDEKDKDVREYLTKKISAISEDLDKIIELMRDGNGG
jgi:hypothetical protein